MTSESRKHFAPARKGDAVWGWAALAASTSAVLAWAACCVLPIALALFGVGLGATGFIAGQRTWLTLLAVVALAAGWWTVLRRARACKLDQSCAGPSKLVMGLLSVASVLVIAALAWQPVIEPYLLMLLRATRA
jgi:mercuric ion transport protein